MKKIIIIALVCLGLQVYPQQPNDSNRGNVWMLGGPDDTTHFPGRGGIGIKFNQSSTDTFTIPHAKIDLWAACSDICDTNGNLLFYTNGMRVADRLGRIMPHGDSLCYSDSSMLYQFYGNHTLDGVFEYQVIILPKPGSPSLYYIIYQRPTYSIPGSHCMWSVDHIQYSIVDMTQNNGYGDVISKDNTLITDTLDFGYMTACRRANGIDWWILMPVYQKAEYHRILLDKEGFHVLNNQRIGLTWPYMRLGNGLYSPDGKLYMRGIDCNNYFNPNSNGRIDIFDFDRNVGFLSNYRNINIGDSGCCSIALSPNKRFLYYSDFQHLYQFDLEASDIPSSRVKVATYDGFTYFYAYTLLGNLVTGLDNKIYCGTVGPWLHVINDPDNLGVACNVTQRSFPLPRYNNSWLPNIPDYRLGMATGMDDPKPGVRYSIDIYPNPASDYLRVKLNFSNNNKPLDLQIRNAIGQEVMIEKLSAYQGIVNMDVRTFADGFYVASLKTETGVVLTSKKFVIKK